MAAVTKSLKVPFQFETIFIKCAYVRYRLRANLCCSCCAALLKHNDVRVTVICFLGPATRHGQYSSLDEDLLLVCSIQNPTEIFNTLASRHIPNARVTILISFESTMGNVQQVHALEIDVNAHDGSFVIVSPAHIVIQDDDQMLSSSDEQVSDNDDDDDNGENSDSGEIASLPSFNGNNDHEELQEKSRAEIAQSVVWSLTLTPVQIRIVHSADLSAVILFKPPPPTQLLPQLIIDTAATVAVHHFRQVFRQRTVYPRPTLIVFDLDSTLISCKKKSQYADPHRTDAIDLSIGSPCADSIHSEFVCYVRPHTGQLLAFALAQFDRAMIFTAASDAYAQAVRRVLLHKALSDELNKPDCPYTDEQKFALLGRLHTMEIRHRGDLNKDKKKSLIRMQLDLGFTVFIDDSPDVISQDGTHRTLLTVQRWTGGDDDDNDDDVELLRVRADLDLLLGVTDRFWLDLLQDGHIQSLHQGLNGSGLNEALAEQEDLDNDPE